MASNNRQALITGSSRGIGRGIALALADDKVNVAVHYYQNEAAANDTLAEVRKRGSDGFVVQADVIDPKGITAMFRKVKNEFGKLDIFVSNARPEVPTFFQPTMDITLEQWDTAFDSQAKAAFSRSTRSDCVDGRWWADSCNNLCSRQPHRRSAALGRYGFRKSGNGVACPLSGGRRCKARNYGQRYKSGMDRG